MASKRAIKMELTIYSRVLVSHHRFFYVNISIPVQFLPVQGGAERNYRNVSGVFLTLLCCSTKTHAHSHTPIQPQQTTEGPLLCTHTHTFAVEDI